PPTKSPTSSASPPEPSPTGAPSAWALPTSSSAAASATASPTSTTGSPARRMRAQSDARYRAPREPLSSRVNQGAHMSRALDTRTAPPTPVTLEDAQSVGALLASSRSAETRRSYASAMRTFTAWRRVWGYPSIPTGPAVVASSIAHRAELVAHSTISRDVAVISAAHLDKGLGDPTAHHGVRQALRSAGRALGTSPSRRATPLTTVLMRQIIDAMDDLETATGKRDRAILLLGLAAALRRRELAALTTNDIARQGAGLLLQIRRSKTDQTGRGDLIGIPLGAHSETCPVLALEARFEASGRKLGVGSPLFSRIYNHSRIGDTALSDRSIARIIQARAAAANINEKDYAHIAGVAQTWVSGHSLRAGHATSAAAAGV